MMLEQLPNSTVCLQQIQTIIPNMSTYPTPPSSSGDSPQPIYFVASPNSNIFSVASPVVPQQYIQAHVLPNTNMVNISDVKMENQPFLRFIEQPTKKFRFRYKSEMAGTHGSIWGISSDRNRKSTYPTVELMNCSEEAVIRCSIYQYKTFDDFKPHPHRLIMKKGREEFDDPHDIKVGSQEGFVATFHSMGIIHTARKNIVSELVRKKTQLKKEFIARMEGRIRELTNAEQIEIKELAEQESKTINLNIVCLKFEAFIVKNGIRSPICEPLYSHGINNLKCALTGDLKIVRMDHCSSPAKGGKEIFLFVERVTKKNIRIRFFEQDDEENDIWEGYGKFTELDVHHQYAIAFKTPAFRDINITSPVRVYMELVRPSDGSKSECREFRYVPNNDFNPGSKRPRSSIYSSSSYNSESIKSIDIPATIKTIDFSPQQVPNLDSWNNRAPMTEKEMEIALNDVGSDEFKMLYELCERAFPEDMSCYTSYTRDSPMEISRQLNNVHITYNNRLQTMSNAVVKMEVPIEDISFAERTYNELKSFIKSKDAHKRAAQMLESYLGEPYRNNALHVFIALNREKEVTFILKMIVLSKQYQLINISNSESFTSLHIAIISRNEKFIAYLLRCEADPCVGDKNGQNALHLAVETAASPSVFEMLLSTKHAKKLIDLPNYEGETPLYVAVEKRNMTAIKILCQNNANVNKNQHKNGYTPLRIAIENQYVDAVKYLLEHPGLDYNLQNDFKNISPFDAANMKQSSKEIVDLLEKYMNEHNIPLDMKQEVEDEESDEDMDQDIDIKPELLRTEDPDALYQGINKLPPKCLDELASLLDESEKYYHLAELLDLSHLLDTGIITTDPSKNLLLYAIEKENINILDIRNFLENLDEFEAVELMDHMAKELKSIK